MTTKTKTTKKGITEEELMGVKLTPVERISAKPGNKNADIIIEGKVLDEEHDSYGKTHKWGVVTRPSYEKILEQGFVDKEGRVIVHLPEPDEDKDITWVSFVPDLQD